MSTRGPAYTYSFDVSSLPATEYNYVTVTAHFEPGAVPPADDWSQYMFMKLSDGNGTTYWDSTIATSGVLPGSGATDLTWQGTMSPSTYQGGTTLEIKFVAPQDDAGGPYLSILSNVVVTIRQTNNIISGNAGIVGVTLSYTDGTPKTATSGADGSYIFTISNNWSGTVTPSKSGYTFSPTDRTYVNINANQTSQDYTVTPITYTISGNAGVAGATLSYTDGAPKTATADGVGDYSFSVSYNWSGTVTPSLTGYTFSPMNKTYANIIVNQTNQDYTATPITYTISGNTGVAGTTLSYTDGTPKTATADGSGDYSFTVSYNWSGTVTPSLTGYSFSPTDITYTNVLANQTSQNYTATPTVMTYTISGNAGIAGATLSYTDTTAKSTTADGSGNYSFIVSNDWSGTVTPSKTAYSFSPVSRTYSNVLANQTGQDYVATAITYTISGNAGTTGAIISYTDGTPKTVTADGSSNYSFIVPNSWSGTVTPSKSGYSFSPVSKTYSSVSANQTDQNYTAILNSPVAKPATNILTISFNANWSAVPGATDYRLDVATDSGFTAPLSTYTDLNIDNDTTYTVSGLTAGTKYFYRVRAYDGINTSSNSNIISCVSNQTSVLSTDLPTHFGLDQNYPNPFNPSTTINYHISNACYVMLKVYDILGHEVAMLVDGVKKVGSYSATFDGERFTSGIYIIRLIARSEEGKSFVQTKKMLLLK